MYNISYGISICILDKAKLDYEKTRTVPWPRAQIDNIVFSQDEILILSKKLLLS